MTELRFKLYESALPATIAVDPFAVATVVETCIRGVPVAIIRLMDGKEYVVSDGLRRVTGDIWMGKSFTNHGD